MSELNINNIAPSDAAERNMGQLPLDENPSAGPSPIEEEPKNDFMSPGQIDAAMRRDKALKEEQVQNELSFEEKYDLLNTTVNRHPLNRVCLEKALRFCEQEQDLPVIEQEIMSFPEFKTATQNPYYMITLLTRMHGLRLIEKDIDGNPIAPEQKEGLTEDEIDDLVVSFSYEVTEVGQAYLDNNNPKSRLIEILNLNPERKETYAELLNFIQAAPRSYQEVQDLLKGRPALEAIIDGRKQTMQSSVFVDKLERAGAIVWNEGWCLTEEGKEYLEELKEI